MVRDLTQEELVALKQRRRSSDGDTGVCLQSLKG
jgi:hypothetical protein